jgi:hypothetical protein
MVLAPASDRPEVLVLRAAAPAADETLELSPVTVDRDGDGRDDVEVHVAVGSAGVEAPSAPFVWLDRAVGPSRDTAEPKKTLERLAAREAGRAKQKKVADDVVKRVGAVRRLLGTLCTEGAAFRVFDGEGNGLACGSLTTVVDSLATAEIGAELARGRLLEAFGALARDGWYFGKTSSAARKRLEKSLLDAVKPASATVSFVDVRPLAPATPHYSALSFEANGALLVRTAEGISRVEPDAVSATPAFARLRDGDGRLADWRRLLVRSLGRDATRPREILGARRDRAARDGPHRSAPRRLRPRALRRPARHLPHRSRRPEARHARRRLRHRRSRRRALAPRLRALSRRPLHRHPDRVRPAPLRPRIAPLESAPRHRLPARAH